MELHYELIESSHHFADEQGLWLKMQSPVLKNGSQPYYLEPVAPGLKSARAALRWQFPNPDGTWPTVEECNANPTMPEGLTRHGDVGLYSIDKYSLKGLKKFPGVSLAQGTATGHSHKLTRNAATLYELSEGQRLLVVKQRVGIKHEEHKTLMLVSGYYRVVIKRQYDKALGQRPVQD